MDPNISEIVKISMKTHREPTGYCFKNFYDLITTTHGERYAPLNFKIRKKKKEGTKELKIYTQSLTR